VRDLGFKPENILLTGDSSGGATAFWLARYLAAAQLPGLPGPGGLLLLSPTADVAHTHRGRGSSMVRNAPSDSVGRIVSSGYSFRALVGALDPAHAAVLAWVAPGARGLETEGLFAGLPPTYVCAGGAEQTLDGIVADNGKHRVEWDAPPDATHDYLLAPWHEPERTETLKRIGAWAAKECWASSGVDKA
jgi:acetyl esterase/lipase